MKKISVLLLLGLAIIIGFSFVPKKSENLDAESVSKEGEIQWLTPEEAELKTKTVPKKIIMDVYTDWCGYCKLMDKNTFANKAVAAYINENFYPVKFNAESREEVTFAGHHFKNSGRTHEFATALQVSGYPSVLFFDENLKLVVMSPGYLDAKDMMKHLKYMAENHYKKTDYETYMSGK